MLLFLYRLIKNERRCSKIALNDLFCIGERVSYQSPYSYVRTGYMNNGAMQVKRIDKPCEVSGTIVSVDFDDGKWTANALVSIPIVNAENVGRRDLVCITKETQEKFKKL